MTAGDRCSCGGSYSAAQRFERLATVDVVICWTCGAETPPLFTAITTCKGGHTLGTYGRISPDGWRYCQACKANNQARYRRAS